MTWSDFTMRRYTKRVAPAAVAALAVVFAAWRCGVNVADSSEAIAAAAAEGR